MKQKKMRFGSGGNDNDDDKKDDDDEPPFCRACVDKSYHKPHIPSCIRRRKPKESEKSEQEKIMALGSLKSLEEQLPSTDFMRIHKSYIVAKNRVNSLHGNQLELGDITLPIGGSYRNEVMAKLFYGTKG